MSVFVVSTSVDSAVEFAFVVVVAVAFVVVVVVVVTFIVVVAFVVVVASVGSVEEFDFIFVSLFVVRRIRR